MPSLIEARDKVQHAINAFKQGVGETRVEPQEVETVTLSPNEAAKAVFDRLIEIKGGRQFIIDIGELYNSKNYDPIYAGNALLTYGRLSTRWVEPDDSNTHKALHRGLRVIFNIELPDYESGEAQEETFVEALGALVHNFAKNGHSSGTDTGN